MEHDGSAVRGERRPGLGLRAGGDRGPPADDERRVAALAEAQRERPGRDDGTAGEPGCPTGDSPCWTRRPAVRRGHGGRGGQAARRGERLELGEEIAGRLPAIRRMLLEAAENRSVERGGDTAAVGANRLGRARHVRREYL